MRARLRQTREWHERGYYCVALLLCTVRKQPFALGDAVWLCRENECLYVRTYVSMP